MKYMVIAKRYEEEEGASVNAVIGQFGRYVDASMFAFIYEQEYSTKARIIKTADMVKLAIED